MKKSKKRIEKAVWRRRLRTLRRSGIAIVVIFLAAVAGWYFLMTGNEQAPEVFMTEAAPDFTLETTSGEDFVMSQHRGEHNVLLYFNEGMG